MELYPFRVLQLLLFQVDKLMYSFYGVSWRNHAVDWFTRQYYAIQLITLSSAQIPSTFSLALCEL